MVEYDGNYYFNPGLPAVQQLVVDGAAEIVRNYDVDGIHLDDYFYPGVAQRAKNVHSRPVIISEWYIYLIYHIVR